MKTSIAGRTGTPQGVPALTPGPWHTSLGEIRDSKGKMIAAVVQPVAYAGTVPNARLIAESPNMLEALERAQKLFKEALPQFDWSRSALDANAIRLLNEVPAEIAAVIARAKGVKSYEDRVRELEAEGLTTSDAQAAADAEGA